MEPQKRGDEIQSLRLEQFIYLFQYFWGCRIQIGHYFLCSNYLGAKTGPKNGIKFEVFDWNNSYINFTIFEDAETKSVIIFHVRLIWVQNEAPKGGKIESFWLEGLHQFQYFRGCLESAIIFHIIPF